MKVFIGSDHRGFELKESIKKWLEENEHNVVDCGNSVYDKDDDFTDFSILVAENVTKDISSMGIVICGSAGGVTIAANKVVGARCVTAISKTDVSHNRRHNNANVLALSSDLMDLDQIQAYVDIFINTDFDPQKRFSRRLGKISEYEKQQKN